MTGAGASVTAVIPAFNAERFVFEAVRSILDQTRGDLELVVVDDGSTDGTLALLRSIRDHRLTVVTGPNRGGAAARNRGVSAAGPSDLVAFLDADDLWDPDKLEEQVAYLTRHPDVLAVGSFMRYISSAGRILGETGQTVGEADLGRIARAELAPFPIQSSLLARRTDFAEVGGFDEVLRFAEDLDLLAKLACRGAVACVPKVLGSYRIHPDSAMARDRSRVNASARFVRQRIAARDAGVELTWEQFSATYRPTWRERHTDRVESCYRSAALWHGEGRPLRAWGYGLLAACLAPTYTLRRLHRQRLRRTPRRRGQAGSCRS